MTPKPTSSHPRSASSRPRAAEKGKQPPEPPLTTEEQLQRIAAMGQRIADFVLFMGQVGTLSGTSAESKDRAIAAFYERLAALEGQLAHIHDELRLG